MMCTIEFIMGAWFMDCVTEPLMSTTWIVVGQLILTIAVLFIGFCIGLAVAARTMDPPTQHLIITGDTDERRQP